MLRRLHSKEVTKNPYVLQEKLRSKITFCQGMWGITCTQNQQAITCLKSFEDGYFWDMTAVDCCIYTAVSQDPVGFIVKAGELMYVPWSWWHKDPPKRQYLSQITWHKISSLHRYDHENLVKKNFSVSIMKLNEITKTRTCRTETHYICYAMNKTSSSLQLPISNHTD